MEFNASQPKYQRNFLRVMGRMDGVVKRQFEVLLSRKMSGDPIVVGAYKTRTKWRRFKLYQAACAMLHLARAMARRRNITLAKVDLTDFDPAEDIRAFKGDPGARARHDYFAMAPSHAWTLTSMSIIRNAVACVCDGLAKDDPKRQRLEKWLAYPTKPDPANPKPRDPVLDDRVHPGVAIRGALDFMQHAGAPHLRLERTCEFACHTLLGLRPGYEMAQENFRLGEFDIDFSTGKFNLQPDGGSVLVKQVHKQDRIWPFYSGDTRHKPHPTVVPPSFVAIFEPYIFKRIKAGAGPSDPVFAASGKCSEVNYYKRYRREMAAAMGLNSSEGLVPYSGRRLYNRCLRLLPVREMQDIINDMGRHINVLDVYVMANAYIAMRQSPGKFIDFNWETYDAQVGPDGWRACVLRALELALAWPGADEVARDTARTAEVLKSIGLDENHVFAAVLNRLKQAAACG